MRHDDDLERRGRHRRYERRDGHLRRRGGDGRRLPENLVGEFIGLSCRRGESLADELRQDGLAGMGVETNGGQCVVDLSEQMLDPPLEVRGDRSRVGLRLRPEGSLVGVRRGGRRDGVRLRLGGCPDERGIAGLVDQAFDLDYLFGLEVVLNLGELFRLGLAEIVELPLVIESLRDRSLRWRFACSSISRRRAAPSGSRG